MSKHYATKSLVLYFTCVFLFILLIYTESYAQKDTEFWFVAPAVSKNHCSGAPGCNSGDAPVSLIITTFDLAATVTISQPANDISIFPATGFTPIVVNIPANSTQRVQLWSDSFNSIPAETQMRKNVENRPDPNDPKKVSNKGIHIEATNMITVYYEVEETYNSDIFSLKGRNAIGTEFYTPFQINKDNHYFNPSSYEPLYSAIDIVAVDPGTTEVVIYPTNEVLGWGTPDSIVISLKQGETYSIIPGHVNAGDYVYHLDPGDRLAGTRIKTRNGKRIAVTLKDDSVHGDSGCWDLLGDQLIPVEAVDKDGIRTPLIGTEYAVMRGDLGRNRPLPLRDFDRIYILATKDGTNVRVTDVTNSTVTNYSLDAGEQIQHDIAANGDITYIESLDADKPIYVLHVTGAQGGCEIGEAILPTISQCTGSFKVGFYRSDPHGSKDFYMNILGRTGALDSFKLDGVNFLKADSFTNIPGTEWWVASVNMTSLIPPTTTHLLENTQDLFHLGIMHGGESNGGNYGYFSNYNVIEAFSYVGGTGQPGAKICYGETVQLVASGGREYEWIPPTYLDDPFSDQPLCTPYTSIKYKVIVKGSSCQVPDTSEVPVNVADSISARFSVDVAQGCAPVTVVAEDLSYGHDDKYNRWTWGDGTPDTYATRTPPPHTYYNKTDSIIDYVIELVVRNDYCVETWQRTIRVYPEITAGFTQDTTIGCHPLEIQFQDTSSGNLDTTGYFWYFGELGQSFDLNPSYIFTNSGQNDSIYNVELIVQSPYFCRDTANVNITVHPYINASLAIDKQYGCSPFSVNLNPTNSVGVDTFKWNINFGTKDTVFNTLTKNLIPISYIDTSQLNGPDTIKIDLITINRMGCSDTFPRQKIIVYPLVESKFDIDTNSICDSVPIQFINNSTGYNLKYDWDFGDGTTASDSLKLNYNHTYLNRSDITKVYPITLNAISDFLCSSISDTFITVYPYINAAFTVEYPNNCSPLDVDIINQSHRVKDYSWNFGDGSLFSTSPGPTLSHRYQNPLEDKDTTYILKLNVVSQEGCKDSTETNILLVPRVAAAFNMSDNNGCNPLNIIFQNVSKGSNLNYKWKFGGIESAISDPSFERTFEHYGANDSVFQVSLIATNQYGCDSSISKPVTLYAYIDADFIVERNDSCSPFPVKITNNSPPGATFFTWNFGDGSPVSNNFEPSHTYTNTALNKRTDILQLVVKNNHACYDTLKRNIIVYPEVNAGFTIDKVQGCQPLAVNFSNTTNIIPGTDFYWRFDDGTFSSSVTPLPHTYTNDQSSSINPTIRLNATSQYGCTDSTSQNIEVYPYIFAKFAVDKASICSDDLFQIDRTGSKGGINQYLWDFDNNGTTDATTSDPVFDHQFTNTSASSDNITIKLTVTNPQGCDTAWTQNITVHPEVVANFELDDYEPCYPYHSILHNTTEYRGIVATNFIWTFGDGSVSISDDEFLEYKFLNLDNETDKSYTITLVAESDYECRDTIDHVITIHPKPNADFNFPVTIDCPPFSVPFENLSEGTNLTYEWNFDDGTPLVNEVNPTHVFVNESYDIQENNIRLISSTTFGCEDTVFKPILIYPKVHVDFEASEWQGCSPLVVDFDGTAINHDMVTWYLDDEAFSTIETPSYRFVNNTPGNLVVDIKFKAKSIYNCMDDTMKQITIYPNPVAEFVPDPILQDFNTETDITPVSLSNYTPHQGSGTWEYAWDYGDGTNDANNNETFTKEYTMWGDINNKNKIPITLIAWNKDNPECIDTITHDITIRPPIPEIDIAEDVADCPPFTVQFSTTTKYIYEDSYQWDFGYNNETGTGASPEFTYTEPGVYIVKLVVEGDGGINWDYKKVTVYEPPEVDFMFSPEVVMVASKTEEETPIRFFNNTQLGAEYLWDFGDGESTVEKEPSHIYKEKGEYYVTLLATSTEGCMDTMMYPSPVVVEGTRKLEFPTAFVVHPDIPADENYNPSYPDVHVFRPIAEGIEKYKLEIYNRWGELIFTTTDVNKGWNGYVKGQLMKQDVYIWRVKATFTDGKPMIMAGDVTLIVSPK
jgi:gliding motility-associated-like protein